MLYDVCILTPMDSEFCMYILQLEVDGTSVHEILADIRDQKDFHTWNTRW